MQKRTFTGLIALALGLSACGQVAPANGRSGRQLSYEELRQEFDRMDRNNDGYVNAREYSLWPDQDASAESWRQREFETRIDLNGDGRSTWNEYYDARRRS